MFNSFPLLRAAFVAILCLILVACESSVSTKVSTYRGDTIAVEPGSMIHIVAEEGLEEDSLEFDHFKSKLAAHLQLLGYTVVDKPSAEYVAALGYEVERQQAETPNSHLHYNGVWGTRHHRNVIVVGDTDGDEFEYLRNVSLKIDRLTPSADEKKQKIIQIKAVSRGKCEHLNVVFDEMLTAIFTNFERADGSIEKVKIKGDARCP